MDAAEQVVFVAGSIVIFAPSPEVCGAWNKGGRGYVTCAELLVRMDRMLVEIKCQDEIEQTQRSLDRNFDPLSNFLTGQIEEREKKKRA